MYYFNHRVFLFVLFFIWRGSLPRWTFFWVVVRKAQWCEEAWRWASLRAGHLTFDLYTRMWIRRLFFSSPPPSFSCLSLCCRTGALEVAGVPWRPTSKWRNRLEISESWRRWRLNGPFACFLRRSVQSLCVLCWRGWRDEGRNKKIEKTIFTSKSLSRIKWWRWAPLARFDHVESCTSDRHRAAPGWKDTGRQQQQQPDGES